MSLISPDRNVSVTVWTNYVPHCHRSTRFFTSIVFVIFMRKDRVVNEIVNQIAEEEGVDPAELDPPLYDIIDPDALQALIDVSGVQQAESDCRVEFLYCGYTVLIEGGGAITIEDPTSATDRESNKSVDGSLTDIPAKIEHREAALQQASTIIATHDRPLNKQITGLLEVVRNALGMEYATLSYVDTDTYVFEAVNSASNTIEAGEIVALGEVPSCQRVVETEQSLVLANIEHEAPELLESTWGVSSYIGVPVFVDEEIYGTFCFYDTEPRAEEFSDWEFTLVELLSNWVSGELEKRQQERAVQSVLIENSAGMS